MINETTWESIELFQLKECYELAALYANDEMAKNVLHKKIKRIEIPEDCYMSDQDDAVYHESEMQIISDAMYELALEGNVSSSDTGFKYKEKIDSLPESGEKEYVLALLSLRKGTTESNRIEALEHLTAALSYAPNDPRLLTLARVLEEV